MNLIILIQHQFPAIPDAIKVNRFGSESIVNSKGRILATGTSAHISGPKSIVEKWLASCGEVWVTDNPMVGDWSVIRVG